MAPYCSEVVKDRDVRDVRDGRLFTGGGVSASIDLGLYLIEHLTSVDVVKEVQKHMDYPYYHPGNGSDEYMSWN